jgi:hypothetical protein
MGGGASAGGGVADMTQVAESTLGHPFFARAWPVVAAHETAAVRALRRENLAGLSGRVLEIGAGAGTNFANCPLAGKPRSMGRLGAAIAGSASKARRATSAGRAAAAAAPATPGSHSRGC